MLVRLEMDKDHMTMAWFDMPPGWAWLFSLAVHLGAAFALGILYFRSLWWSARRFSGGGSLVATIALMGVRLVVMGGVLTLASLEGALPLLTLALGVLVARFAVMHRVRRAIP